MDGTLTFSGSTFLGYSVTGIVCCLLPVIVFLWLRRYRAAGLFPLIAGIIMYFLSNRVCDISLGILLASAPPEQKAAAAMECIGLFEELGRYLAMKCPLSDIRKSGAAVCYAVGHAGLESLTRGMQTFRIIGWGKTLNSDGIAHFLRDKSPERAAEITRQLTGYAESGLLVNLMDALNAAVNFGVHIALSLLIYEKCFVTDFRKRWLVLAIVLHIGLNELYGLSSLAGEPVFTKLTGIFCGTAVILLVYRMIDGKTILEELKGGSAEHTKQLEQ